MELDIEQEVIPEHASQRCVCFHHAIYLVLCALVIGALCVFNFWLFRLLYRVMVVNTV